MSQFHRRQPAPGFGATLAALREARRLSQGALARHARMSHGYISRLESGSRLPRRGTIEALVIALRCTPDERDWLLLAAGYAPMSDSLQRAIGGLLRHPQAIAAVLAIVAMLDERAADEDGSKAA